MITYTEHDKVPCPRNGHSACVYGNFMYIFGGRSNDNVKLNDTWKINLSSLDWEEIECVNFPPLERSGHSCDVIGKYMIVYGGIHEITKEQNDMHLLDLETNTWISIFEPEPVAELGSPTKVGGTSSTLNEKSMTTPG